MDAQPLARGRSNLLRNVPQGGVGSVGASYSLITTLLFDKQRTGFLDMKRLYISLRGRRLSSSSHQSFSR